MTPQKTANAVQSAAASTGSLLDVQGVVKRFGAREVLKGISLQVMRGEFLTLLGESGSGKTTLLRLIAGFEQLSGGEIRMNGERLDALPAYRRPVNTVFQHYALFPHLSVRENVEYGLRATGTPKDSTRSRAEAALALVKMQEYFDSRPSKLSGGQQQRVALARALVNRPQLLLLDEPLSALDANLRKQMQVELKSLQRELGITFLFVTHDQEEAMALSDRIALMKDGWLEQVAAPREIYEKPETLYAAQFIGQTNILRAEVDSGMANTPAFSWPSTAPNGKALFSLRPESIRRAAPGESVPSGAAKFRARITEQLFAGSSELLELDSGGQALRCRTVPAGPLQGEFDFYFLPGDAVQVRE